MSSLQEIVNEEIIAIFCADIHLSIKPPVWRSAEPDWFEAMKRPLHEIDYLTSQFCCPVICAGDIFDRWNSPPELINFALRNLPFEMYCIPGQHDLPNHNYQDINKSAYGTLAETGIIQNMLPDSKICTGDLVIHPYPYGYLMPVFDRMEDGKIHIAVCHDYCWIKSHSYPNAPEEKQIFENSKSNQNYFEYDAVVYGDNHKGFLTRSNVFNCGTLMRRACDEINYKPQIGLFTKSKQIIPYYLDTSQDKYIEPRDNQTIQDAIDLTLFFSELRKLGDTALNFSKAVKRLLNKDTVPKEVKIILTNAMEI